MAEPRIGGLNFPLTQFYKDKVLHEFDVRKWLQPLANTGLNCYRFLPFDVWNVATKAEAFCPYQLENDKWNLAIWNPEYFRVYKIVFGIFIEYGVMPILELLDNCQVNGPQREFSAWHVNTNGVETFYDKNADPLVRAWIEKCFVEFPDIQFGECNEGTENIRRVVMDVINPLFKSRGRAPFCFGACAKVGDVNSTIEHLKGDASKVFGDDISLEIFRPAHGCKNATDPNFLWPIANWGKSHHIAFGLSDDGVFDGDSQCDFTIYNGKTQRRPSAAAWYLMTNKALQDKKVDSLLWFEHCGKAIMDTACQVTTFTAISTAIHDVNGNWPLNWQRWPEPIEPECQVGQTQTMRCWDGSEIITHICKDGKWLATGTLCPAVPDPESPPKITWQGIVGIVSLVTLIVLGIMFLKGC